MTTLNRFTIDNILALKPCWGMNDDDDFVEDLARTYILEVWPADQTTVTAREIADERRVNSDDTVWLLTHLLSLPQLRLFLCWCAEQHMATTISNDDRDPRVAEALTVVRRYVDGLATDEELNVVKMTARRSGQSPWAVWAAGTSESYVRMSLGCSTGPLSVASSARKTATNELVRLHENLGVQTVCGPIHDARLTAL